MSNLSRRSLVASAAALPALAVPAVVAAALPRPKTRIAKLWQKLHEARTPHEANSAMIDKLEAEVESLLPEPHPSIANVPANFVTASNGTKVSQTTELSIPMFSTEPSATPVTRYANTKVPNAAAEYLPRIDRLNVRQALAEEYEKIRHEAQSKTALPGLHERSEELCEPIGRLESLIERSPIKVAGRRGNQTCPVRGRPGLR
jgi:hypothetical protein